MSVQTYCWCNGEYDKAKAELAALWAENEALARDFNIARDAHDKAVQELITVQKRVADLEKKTQISMTLADLAGLARCFGICAEMPDEDETEVEIGILQDVKLNNEDGTYCIWPLAAYVLEYPEEGFIGIGDEPPALPMEDPAMQTDKETENS